MTDDRIDLFSVIEQVRARDVGGDPDAALDLLYDAVDRLFSAGQFAEVDVFLKHIATDTLSCALLMGLLTITLSARSRLESRSFFFARVKDTFLRREDRTDELLAGLS